MYYLWPLTSKWCQMTLNCTGVCNHWHPSMFPNVNKNLHWTIDKSEILFIWLWWRSKVTWLYTGNIPMKSSEYYLSVTAISIYMPHYGCKCKIYVFISDTLKSMTDPKINRLPSRHMSCKYTKYKLPRSYHAQTKSGRHIDR